MLYQNRPSLPPPSRHTHIRQIKAEICDLGGWGLGLGSR